MPNGLDGTAVIDNINGTYKESDFDISLARPEQVWLSGLTPRPQKLKGWASGRDRQGRGGQALVSGRIPSSCGVPCLQDEAEQQWAGTSRN